MTLCNAEKLPVVELVKKMPYFHGIQMYITIYTHPEGWPVEVDGTSKTPVTMAS